MFILRDGHDLCLYPDRVPDPGAAGFLEPAGEDALVARPGLAEAGRVHCVHSLDHCLVPNPLAVRAGVRGPRVPADVPERLAQAVVEAQRAAVREATAVLPEPD